MNDGYMHIHDHKNTYDVIMVDSTEPVGPAVQLFTRGFYQGIYDALKEDGIFVAQTDNPWFKADLIRKVNRDVKEVFPIVRVYWANIPTYPSGLVDVYDGQQEARSTASGRNTNSAARYEVLYTAIAQSGVRSAAVRGRAVQVEAYSGRVACRSMS